MKKFNRHWDRVKQGGEVNTGGSITEQSYIKLSDQIKNMLEAGERLEMSRRPKDVQEDQEVDPTMVRGFDAVDAAKMAQATKTKLIAALRKRDQVEKERRDAAEAALAEKEAAIAAAGKKE